MPMMPADRSNAWELWKTGRITATNVTDLGVDSTPALSIFANLAIKGSYNAIRLHLGWGSNNYTLMTKDWQRISVEGWNSSTPTVLNPQRSISAVAAHISYILDTCHSLGLGVIFTGGFFSDQQQGMRLWEDTPAGLDAYGLSHEESTPAGIQGNLGFFWQKTVQFFGNHPALIGLDILNEPTPKKGLSLAESRGARKDTWPQLANYLVKVIRRVDPSASPGSSLPRLPIIIQGAILAGVGLKLFLNPDNVNDTSYLVRDHTYGPSNTLNPNPSDDRIVYSSHAYLPAWVAMQGVFPATYFSLGSTYPISTPAREWIQDIDGTEKFVKRDFTTNAGWDAMFSAEIALKNLGLPIFLGEFGAIQPRLDQVHPPATDRESRNQRVSTVPTITPTTTASTLVDFQQITSIAASQDGQSHTFELGNIPSSFHPVYCVDPARTMLWGWSINSNNEIVDAQGVVKPAGEWGAHFFTNRTLTATIYLVSGGLPVFPPIVENAPITIIGGIRSFTANIPSNVTAIPPGAAVGGKFPPVAVMQLDTTTSPASIEASRTSILSDTLRLCQRNKFCWAYFSDAPDSSGFIGWRASPEARLALANAANGDPP